MEKILGLMKRQTGLFQGNPADRLTLFVVHKVGIDLGGCHVLMDEHLADSIDIRAGTICSVA